MKRTGLMAGCFFLLLTLPALAAEKPIVAVFDIEAQGVAPAKDALDRLSNYLGSLLAERGFQVVPRSQLKERLLQEKKESYKACYDEACQIEIGKELAAQKSLASQVIKLGKSCKVTLTLYDLKRAASERAATFSGECDEDAIVASLEEAVKKLFQESEPLVDKKTSSPAAASDYDNIASRLEAMEKAWATVKKLAENESLDKKERARLLRKFIEDFPNANPHKKEAQELAEFFETGTIPGLEWVFSTPAAVEFTKSEITVAQYKACVKAGKCSAPKSKDDSKYCNWGYADRDNHPVNCADWHQATAFCEWAGGRLPTEQEWEKEASNLGSRTYPWGNKTASCEYAVMKHRGDDGCGLDSTWPVCSKPAGNSVSGLCDMSGNVWEWTSSSEGSDRVLRGGSWGFGVPGYLSASYRSRFVPAFLESVGFRCVRSSR